MRVLSIHSGHTATVGLLEDGRVIAVMSEERLLRKKNYAGFPFKSWEWVRDNYLQNKSVDFVVLPSDDPAFFFGRGKYEKNLIHSPIVSGVSNILSGGATNKESIGRSWFVRFVKRLLPQATHLYTDSIYAYIHLNRKRYAEKIKREVGRIVGVAPEKIIFADHHRMHAYSTLFNLDPKKPWLIFTIDGYGDGLCATVSRYENGVFTRIAETPERHSLGMLYAYTTRYLGMKMNEHEFKVMGLAPYAKERETEPVIKKLRKFIWLDPQNRLVFKTKKNMMWADLFLERVYKGHRFDSVAAGVQKLTEELLCEWVREAIRQTGIPNVAASGGVFMNVKASMLVEQMPEVKEMFVMPSAGDESLVFGGMFLGYKTLAGPDAHPEPVKDIYLGNEYSEAEIEKFIAERDLKSRYAVKKMKDPAAETAKLLADGGVVARLAGRMEWGARALGNRSILADPRRHDTVRLINEMIKDRDFWMPFTPSMLDGEDKKYIVNPKGMQAPYMCIAFPGTAAAEKDIPAAIHPYDSTVRPQVVYRDWNPSYYDLLAAFKKLTGVGAVLNTSFNLHGEPNVCSLDDALRTLEKSGLKHLVLGPYLVNKNS